MAQHLSWQYAGGLKQGDYYRENPMLIGPYTDVHATGHIYPLIRAYGDRLGPDTPDRWKKFVDAKPMKDDFYYLEGCTLSFLQTLHSVRVRIVQPYDGLKIELQAVKMKEIADIDQNVFFTENLDEDTVEVIAEIDMSGEDPAKVIADQFVYEEFDMNKRFDGTRLFRLKFVDFDGEDGLVPETADEWDCVPEKDVKCFSIQVGLAFQDHCFRAFHYSNCAEGHCFKPWQYFSREKSHEEYLPVAY